MIYFVTLVHLLACPIVVFYLLRRADADLHRSDLICISMIVGILLALVLSFVASFQL